MKRLLLLALLLASLPLAARDLPYPASADAHVALQQALARAKGNHLPVLVFFGANWCEDCRALARSLALPANAGLMAQSFNVVKVNVGNFNRNLDIDHQYGDPIGNGIPAAVLLSPSGRTLYSTRAGELSNARRMSASGVHDFFEQARARAERAH